MAREVINPDQRLSRCRGDALGAHDARQNPADKARPCGYGDGVDLGKVDTCPPKRLFHANVDLFGVGPRRNFGDNASKSLVQRGLTENDRREDLGPPFPTPHHSRGGIVAARFDAKDGEALAHAGSGCAGFHRR